MPEQPTDNVDTANDDQAAGQQPAPLPIPTVDELAYGNFLMVYDVYALREQHRQQIIMVNARMTELENRVNNLIESLNQAEQQVGDITPEQEKEDGGNTV